MDTTAVVVAAGSAQLPDLDCLAGLQPEARAGLRGAPYPLEPAAWVEHRCQTCGEVYGASVEVCLLDRQPLDDVIVSKPYLWLG